MVYLVIACLLVALPAPAQDKPDFSGRWTLVAAGQTPDDAPRAMTVRQTVTRTNVRGEPVTPYFRDISIAREFANERREEHHPIGIESGFVSGVAGTGQPAGPRGYFAVKWDGPALVFESATYSGYARETGAWTERREVWSVDPDGRLRVAISSRSSTPTTDGTLTLIFQRQGAAVPEPVTTPFVSPRARPRSD